MIAVLNKKYLLILGLLAISVIGIVLILRDKPKQVQALKVGGIVSESGTPEAGYFWNSKNGKYERQNND